MEEEEEDEEGASLPHLGFPRHHRHFVMMMTATRDVSQWSCIERERGARDEEGRAAVVAEEDELSFTSFVNVPLKIVTIK